MNDQTLRSDEQMARIYEDSVLYDTKKGLDLFDLAVKYEVGSHERLRKALDVEKQRRLSIAAPVTSQQDKVEQALRRKMETTLRKVADELLDFYLKSLAPNKLSVSHLWPTLESFIIEENRRRLFEGDKAYSRWIENKTLEHEAQGRANLKDRREGQVQDLIQRSRPVNSRGQPWKEEAFSTQTPLFLLPQDGETVEEPMPAGALNPEDQMTPEAGKKTLEELIGLDNAGAAGVPVGAFMFTITPCRENPLSSKPLQDKTYGGPVSDDEFQEIYGVPSPRQEKVNE